MSKQTFVMTTKNYPRSLDLGAHAEVIACGEPVIGFEL